MLAGTDGVGKIQFSNARLSNYIGTVALTFILFPADWKPNGTK